VPRPGLAFVAITTADICGEIASLIAATGVGRRYGPSARERPAHLRRPANMRVSRPR